MATLTSTKIKNTYDALLKSIDNDAIGSTAKQITDGLGNTTPLYVSTTQVGIGVTPEAGLNLHVYGDAKIGSNLTVIGNLVVEGSTTTVGTDTLTVKDPLIVLANNNTSTDAVDIGFYGKYTPSGTTLYSGLFREALTGKYRLFKGLQIEPTTTVSVSGTGYDKADLVIGNIETNGVVEDSSLFTFSKDILINKAGTTKLTIDNVTQNKSIELECTSLNNVLNAEGDMIFSSGSPIFKYTSSSFEVISVDSTFGGDIIANGDITLSNSSKIKWNGTSALEIYDDGTNAIKIETGSSRILDVCSDIFQLKAGDTNNNDLMLTHGSEGVSIYYRGNTNPGVKFATTSDGVDVTGELAVSGTGQSSFGGQVTIPLTPTSSTDAASKGYVDTQVGANNELSEVLANGNITDGTDIAVSAGDDITFTDTSKILLGDGDDLQIYHDGSNGYIDNSTGNLLINSKNADGDIKFYGDDGGGTSTEEYFRIDGGSGVTQFSNPLRFSDNNKAYFGDSNGLQIYNTGSDSWIVNTVGDLNISQSSGDVIITNANVGIGIDTPTLVAGKIVHIHGTAAGVHLTDTASGTTSGDGGYVAFDNPNLYIQNKEAGSMFFETSGTTALTIDDDGDSTFAGNVSIVDDKYFAAGTGGDLIIRHLSSDNSSYIQNYTGDFNIENRATTKSIFFRVSNSSAGDTTALTINSSGNVIVNGTTDYGKVTIEQGGDVSGLVVNNTTAHPPRLYLRDAGGSGYSELLANNDLYINASSVGIGTDSPVEQFTVGGTGTQGRIGLNTTGVDHPYIQMTQFGSPNTNVAVRIDAGGDSYFNGGNVGIGTDDPDYPLHVKNSSTSYLFSETTGPGAAAGFRWKTPDSEFSWYSAGGLNNMNLYDYTASAVRMTIDSDGNAIFTKNVTVGTAAASDFVLSLRGGVGGFFGWDDSANKTILQAPNTRKLSLRVNSDTFGAGTEAILIDSSGNVGIGVNASDYWANASNLVVGGLGAVSGITIATDGNLTGSLIFADGTGGGDNTRGGLQYDHSTNNMLFRVNNDTKMRITSGGNVLIGTDGDPTSGGFKFDAGTDSILRIGHATGTATGSNYTLFYLGSSVIGSISQNGTSAVSYNTSSDYRLKEDLQDFAGLDMVSKIPVYDFKWKSDESRSYGVMAHELKEVLPDAVTGDKDAEEMQGVDYSKIVPLLVKSIQELKAEVDDLKNKCNCK